MSTRSPRQSDHDPIAAEERARVIAAARALLAEEQVALGFSIDTLAARAGVARAQVQRRFGTPAGVLEALWDQLLSDGCLALLPPAFQLSEPTAVLAELIAIHGRFWDGERRVIRRIKAFAALDPELERALLARERLRREGLRKLVERFPRKLHAGTELEPLALFALLTAFELFDALAGPERRIAEVIGGVQALARGALASGRSAASA
jgi:AcrR family transcriptional regulator